MLPYVVIWDCPFPAPGCGVFLFLGEGPPFETRGSGMERMFHVGSHSVINPWLMTCTSLAPVQGSPLWNGVTLLTASPDPATRRGGKAGP